MAAEDSSESRPNPVFARPFSLFVSRAKIFAYCSQSKLFTKLLLHDARQILLPSFRVHFSRVLKQSCFPFVDPSVVA